MSLKILLADDSMTAQNMGKKILLEAGFKVIAVSNGSMAMKKIASEKPDILVLDVFMPGYSGLEICDKIKGAPESSRTPIILTVGKMEPFRPEEGNKVKADGLIIKPFEASDLVAAVQKLAAKLNATAAAEAEKTLKMAAPVEEIKDASYEDWKTTADSETADAEAPAKFSVPQDMTGAAAFDIPPEEPKAATGEMQVQASGSSSWAQSTDAPPSTSPWGSEAVTSALDTAAPSWAEPSKPLDASSEPAWSAADSLAELHPTTRESAELPSLQPEPLLDTSGSPAGFDSALSATVPGLEVTSASAEEVVAPPAPGFEAGFGAESDAGADLRASTDPSLLTDQTKMVSEFSTKFGVENPEPTPVGVAEHMLEEAAPVTEIAATPEIAPTMEAAPVTEAEPAPVQAESEPAHEEPAPPAVDEAEQAAILAREMHQAFANVPPEPPLPEPDAVEAIATSSAGAAAPEAGAGDQAFADALNAAISGAPVATPEPMEPVKAAEFDPQMVSRAIDRVLDRFKSELMAEIMRELKR